VGTDKDSVYRLQNTVGPIAIIIAADAAGVEYVQLPVQGVTGLMGVAIQKNVSALVFCVSNGRLQPGFYTEAVTVHQEEAKAVKGYEALVYVSLPRYTKVTVAEHGVKGHGGKIVLDAAEIPATVAEEKDGIRSGSVTGKGRPHFAVATVGIGENKDLHRQKASFMHKLVLNF
jgi:hypothetical protein